MEDCARAENAPVERPKTGVVCNLKKIMYNLNRLEWHLGDRGESLNPAEYCVVLSDDKRTFDSPQSLVVALAKSQDHRAFCGVFVFGQRNAVRRWLRLRYPDTRANQIGERGLSPRARWLKQSGTVQLRGHGSEKQIGTGELWF